MWREENVAGTFSNQNSQVQMRSVGVTPGGMSQDIDNLGTTEPGADAPEAPAETEPAPGGETPPAGE